MFGPIGLFTGADTRDIQNPNLQHNTNSEIIYDRNPLFLNSFYLNVEPNILKLNLEDKIGCWNLTNCNKKDDDFPVIITISNFTNFVGYTKLSF